MAPRACHTDSGDGDAAGELGGEVCSDGVAASSLVGERWSMIGLFLGEGTTGRSSGRGVLSVGVTGVIAFSRV